MGSAGVATADFRISIKGPEPSLAIEDCVPSEYVIMELPSEKGFMHCRKVFSRDTLAQVLALDLALPRLRNACASPPDGVTLCKFGERGLSSPAEMTEAAEDARESRSLLSWPSVMPLSDWSPDFEVRVVDPVSIPTAFRMSPWYPGECVLATLEGRISGEACFSPG
jgi:hypothetical protein